MATSIIDTLVGSGSGPVPKETPQRGPSPSAQSTKVNVVPYSADLDPEASTFLPWLWKRLVDDGTTELYFPGQGKTGFADLVKLFSGDAHVAVILTTEPEARMVGYISWSLMPLGTRLVAMAGFMFFREFWGHGLTDHAARASFEYWFSHTPVEIVIGACPATHKLAMRFNQRVGLQHWGTIPGAHVHNGLACDAVLWGITKDYWLASREVV